MLPPLPSWAGLHVLIVHFPIGLLFTAPLALAAALFLPKYRREFAIGAALLLFLGTVSAFVATSTGGAAEEPAERMGTEVKAVLEQHEELAEGARNLFTVITIALAALLSVPLLLKKTLSPRMLGASLIVILAAALAGDILLANAAHEGGRLVHVYGVRAVVAGSPPPAGQWTVEDDD